MPSLVSEFYVYNSTGKLLSGDGDVYSNEYSNLAKQIDSKRNALYFELLHNSNTLILGCSVMVEEVGGREERIVCVGKYSEFSGHESTLIMQFYDTVSTEIAHLQKLEYRLVGLWEEYDANDFSRFNELTADTTMVDYVYGKLLANEKVSVKSASAATSVYLINSIFSTVGNSLESDLKFMASQYPYESDISICPIEPNPDFELDEHVLKWKQSPLYSEYYMLLPRVFREKTGDIKSYVEVSDRNRLSFYTKNFAFRAYTWDVLDIFATSESLYKLFELYKNDISILTQIFKERSTQIRQMPITNEAIVANIIALYSKQLSSQSSMFSYMGEDEALRSLFERIRNAGVKKKLDIVLLRNRGLWSYVIKDVIRRIYGNEDKELLAALCNVSFPYGGKSGERFRKNIASVLSSYDNDKLVELLKFVGNNVKSSPATGGIIFVNYISEQLRAHDLSSRLTTNEAENLDRYFNTNYVVAKQKAQKKKKQNMMTMASYALVAMILIAGIAYVFTHGGPMAVLANLTGENNSLVDGNVNISDNFSNTDDSMNQTETVVSDDVMENESLGSDNQSLASNSTVSLMGNESTNSSAENDTNQTVGYIETSD
ncbi:hypothetical protein [Methanolobus bombayensis]|uniref:hypothetical protein n=1 Tax=Methanolobus bombayensis TaxID=38023 RepID=UPI001AE60E32|nr:hypothetical protein [Methanolobus bombayensis]MBP1908741.1 hypothetical protein [Methanolobus bombayensis]